VEDEEGSELRRFQIDISQFLSSGKINLSSVFCLMSEKGLSTEGKQFFVPLLNRSYSIGQEPLSVPLEELQEKKISVVELASHYSPVS